MARRKAAGRSLPARLLRWLVAWPLMALAVFLIACTLLIAAYRYVPPPVTTVQMQRTVAATFGPADLAWSRSWRSLDDISPHLPRAVIAAEDGRFYQHRGFDWEELQKAREEAERRGRPMRGASTISQQLAKNLFLTTHRSYVRKGLEYPLTFILELILPKERIIELYLNVVEWGPGVYGAEAAAQYHYGVSASQLTREQSARLAAVLPAPLTRRPGRMTTYSQIIMRRMSQMGW